MRNAWRVLAFDVAAPGATIAALLMIGYALDWRVWWVAVCSVLCTLIVEGMIVNFVLFRRDRVTLATDDDGPGLRLAVVGLTTAALVAAVLVTYTQWSLPDRRLARDMDDVVQVSVKFAESTMTYSPAEPTAGIDRAAALMNPEQAEKFRASYGNEAKKQTSQNISAQARTISAGVSAISAGSAVVAVVVGATREQPGKPQERVVVGLQVALSDKTGEWRVVDLVPLSPAPSQ
ncbi:MAG: hypothetical protein WAM92_17265 [Mycobacterium sp.]